MSDSLDSLTQDLIQVLAKITTELIAIRKENEELKKQIENNKVKVNEYDSFIEMKISEFKRELPDTSYKELRDRANTEWQILKNTKRT
jgi:hypothetical protein